MSGIFISFIHSFAFITADFKNMILAIFLFLFCFVFLLISAVGALACWKFLYPGCKQNSFDLFLYSVNLLSLSLQIFFSPTLYFSFWNPIIWIFLLLILLTKNIYFQVLKPLPSGKVIQSGLPVHYHFLQQYSLYLSQLPGLISTSCFEEILRINDCYFHSFTYSSNIHWMPTLCQAWF